MSAYNNVVVEFIDQMNNSGRVTDSVMTDLQNLSQDERDHISKKLYLPLGLSTQKLIQAYNDEKCPGAIIDFLVELEACEQLDRYLASKPYDERLNFKSLVATLLINQGRTCNLEIFDIVVKHARPVSYSDFVSFVREKDDKMNYQQEKVEKLAWIMSTASLDKIIKAYSPDESWFVPTIVTIREQRRRR